MEVIDIQAVRDCLAEVSDCEDKQYALALLEWAIGKRTFDLDEHDKQIRAEAFDECIKILKESYPIIDNEDILYGFSCAIQRMEQLKGAENDNSIT